MRTFAEIPRDGASNDNGVVDNGYFRWLFFEYFRDAASLLYSDMQSVVGFSMIQNA